MLNQVVVVGRIRRIEKIEGTKKARIFLNVPRSYKNNNGEYDVDIVEAETKGQVAEATTSYCKEDNIIGIKGYLERLSEKDKTMVIAKRVTFLSSKKEKEKK